ncbi:MAG TPA: ABC transporter ATP-binding protein [Chitinophagales bacterium]|nr:ABC transporter ATP-binding protein [Chitinophagales bacterium]
MSIVISAEGLSKMYHIGKKQSGNFREAISERVHHLFSKKEQDVSEFWALRDVSFEVEQGEVLGIIGRNGAGKSTLLKILSRITEPTEGRIEIDGRIAALLEVGTGFHPELTGRENIFMNGAILGMKQAEIKNKFDEIVSFSGIGQFIDTPVKRYSSGMYVRLAFAVAAHLEPEILIVDEVLAVGDAEFQKKCLGKMDEVAKGGRTILFVSHNMSAVSSLCSKGILMSEGRTVAAGPIEEVISYYLKNIAVINSTKEWTRHETISDANVKPLSLRLINENSDTLTLVKIDKTFGIEFNYEILNSNNKPVPNFHFFNADNSVAFISMEFSKADIFRQGHYKSVMWIPANFLNEGFYTVGAALSTLNPTTVHFFDNSALTFEVVDSLDSITRSEFTGKIKGAVRPVMKWDTSKID